MTFSLYSILFNCVLKIAKMINFLICISVNHTYTKEEKTGLLISKDNRIRMAALTTVESPAPKDLGSATVAARSRASSFESPHSALPETSLKSLALKIFQP